MDDHRMCINNKWEKSQLHWLKQKENFGHLQLKPQGLSWLYEEPASGAQTSHEDLALPSLSKALLCCTHSWFLPWPLRGDHSCSGLTSSLVQDQQILFQVIQAKALGLVWLK